MQFSTQFSFIDRVFNKRDKILSKNEIHIGEITFTFSLSSIIWEHVSSSIQLTPLWKGFSFYPLPYPYRNLILLCTLLLKEGLSDPPPLRLSNDPKWGGCSYFQEQHWFEQHLILSFLTLPRSSLDEYQSNHAGWIKNTLFLILQMTLFAI